MIYALYQHDGPGKNSYCTTGRKRLSVLRFAILVVCFILQRAAAVIRHEWIEIMTVISYSFTTEYSDLINLIRILSSLFLRVILLFFVSLQWNQQRKTLCQVVTLSALVSVNSINWTYFQNYSHKCGKQCRKYTMYACSHILTSDTYQRINIITRSSTELLSALRERDISYKGRLLSRITSLVLMTRREVSHLSLLQALQNKEL